MGVSGSSDHCVEENQPLNCTCTLQNTRAIMKKKLTLVIDDEVIERAKRHARAKDISLSELVEHYLVEQTQSEGWNPPKGTVLSRLTGAVQQDTSQKSDDERLYQALRDKYA